MICPYCQLDKRLGHSEDCILSAWECPRVTESRRVGRLTPAEIVALRDIAFMSRIDPISDREPMMLANGEPIPWLVALNIDPARFR